MSLVSKLRLFLVLMLGLALSGAALSVWSAMQADFNLRRLGLANRVYAANLELSNHTYQLFKQFGDALIVGRKEDGELKAQLIRMIRSDIATIRELIGQEIELVGEEEIEELSALSAIELQIERLVAELTAITGDEDVGDIAGNWDRLSRVLDGDTDIDFRKRIDEALAGEAAEVAQTRAEAEAQLAFYRKLSALFAIMALIGAIASYIVLKKNVQARLKALSDGAERLSSGELSHRIDAKGADELAGLARTLNQLSEHVGNREQALRKSNSKLEQKVQDRTQRLEVLLKEVRKTEANRKRLMADVSHELRTPLTVIRGEADIALRGEKEPEEYRQALKMVREAAMHTSRLVDDLLFVARHEAGEARLDVAEADLLEILEPLATGKGTKAAIITSLETATLRCDPGRIRQALLILLENARHYGGDIIEIRVDPSPHGLRIAIEDNGPGLSDADKKSAFERFFRGSNAAERFGDGAGLGLPVAKSIIETHGGTIDLEDRKGGGLRAVMMLPARTKLKAVS